MSKDKEEENKVKGEDSSASEEKDTKTKKGQVLKSKKKDEIDYEAELEKEQKKAKKVQKTLGKAEYKIEKLKKEKKDFEEKEKDFEKKFATKEDVKKMVEDSNQTILNEVTKEKAENLAYSIADSPAEAKLILHHYENSIRKKGELMDDMKKATALANQGRLTERFEEVERADRSKRNKGKGDAVGSGGKEEESKKRPELNKKEEAIVRQGKLSWNGKNWVGKSGRKYDRNFKLISK